MPAEPEIKSARTPPVAEQSSGGAVVASLRRRVWPPPFSSGSSCKRQVCSELDLGDRCSAPQADVGEDI